MAKKVLTAVASFHTTSDALAFQQAAFDHNLTGRLSPVPRQLSAGCGMAWRQPGGTAAGLAQFAQQHKLSVEQVAELNL